MWPDQTSIQTKFLRHMIIIALVSIGLWCLIWIHGEYSVFKIEAESLRTDYIESQKTMLKSQVSGVVKYVNYMKDQAEQDTKFMVKERVYEAHQIALSIYRNNKASKTPSEIGRMIKDALRPIRFNAGRGYYFAASMDGVEQLYPVRPEFEGKNLIDLQDSKGNYVIQDEINIIKESGEGFIRDYWTKPDKEAAELFPIISFVKYFKPLDWYFGAGEYIDDATEQIQNEVLNRIANLRFEAEGYFFGSTFNGSSLFSNGKVTSGTGSNIWGLTDPNGVKIIQEQRKAVENPNGGFVSYSWHKLDASIPSPKISYVLGIPEWEWTIGAGVHIDTIENAISKRKETLEKGLRKKLTNSTFILITLLLLIYFWSKRISNQMTKEIEAFSLSLKKANIDTIMINSADLHLREFRDIASFTNKMLTDRKQAEDVLRKSDEKYQTILSSIEESYFEVNQRGEITFFNEAFPKIIGYPPDELMGMKNDKYLDPEYREKVTKSFNEVWKTGIPIKLFEYELIRKNGERRTVQTSTLLMTDENGQKVGFRGIIRDVSDHKLMEKALKESEEKYRSMMGAMKDAVYICSPEFRIEYMNPRMVERIGHNAIGEHCHKALYNNDDRCPWCIFNKVQQGEHVEYELNNPESGKYYFVINSPIYHSDGSISKLTIFQDITERKAIESQIQQAQKIESIGTLAGGIAHDFNNILFPIVGHTEMLLEDIPEDSPLRNSLNEIYTGALRARDLVKQILTFSRQDNHEIKLITIQPVIKEALQLIRSTIPTSIEIKQYIRKECGVIKADPTKIHQIVMNLATNAYHAMEETGGELKVNLKEVELGDQDVINPDMKPGTYACLTVADTGYGIDKNVIEKIFDPFYTSKEIGKGTGLGLSVVHGIVQNTGGSIHVYSEPGQGTEFHVYLPVVKSALAKKEILPKEPIQGGTERILLVDDEEAIVFMEKQMLERLGYQVVARTSSVEALEAFRANPDKFDMVITDMAMPNMSGDQLTSELIKIRPDIPVMLCTGFSERIPEEKAESMGIKGFLMKPIVRKDLANKIREVLDK
jgi:PAS domain S-box-containing protein